MSTITSRPRPGRGQQLSAALLLIASACSPQRQTAADGNASPLAAASLIATAASSPATPGEAEAERFALTMPLEQQSMQALTNLQVAQKRHPDVDVQSAYDMGRDRTWEPMLARLDGQPVARQAVEAAGISTHDFILTNWVSLQATGAGALVDDAGSDVSSAARASHVSADNIKFMRQHGDEVRRLQAEAVAKARGG